MKTLWRIITTPIRWAWLLFNFIRELTLNIIFVLVVLAGIGLYSGFSGINRSTNTVQDGVLLLNLGGTLVDASHTDNPLRQLGNELLGSADRRQMETPLFDLVERIRQAKNDQVITGLVLSLKDFVGADQPSLQYVGKALSQFRQSGKPIYAIGDSYSQSQYYLASFADRIYLTPQGMVDLNGLATNNLYYKSMLDKLKVNTHIYRVGSYKSAVEPFLRDNMSEEAREDSSRWVNLMWDSYLDDIAKNRKLTTTQLFPDATTIVERHRQLGGDSTTYALRYKLVDKIASRVEIESDLMKEFGTRQQSFKQVSIYDYPLQQPANSKQQIGIILVNGSITVNASSADVVNAENTASQLKKARYDNNIKSVILRVNSPGGSVTGSEVIRIEVEALRNAGKPVVVSMGGLAASGGYWVSTPANYLIASPNTLTGSIGIFGMIPTFEQSLAAIGVNTDGVSTSSLAGSSITKDISTELSTMIQLQIEHGYRTFINLVANARNKTAQQVEQIAQGRVWIGIDAKEHGLVDQLGDFDDAIIKALELANISDKAYQLRWYDAELNWLEKWFDKTTMSADILLRNIIIKTWLPSFNGKIATELTKQKNTFDLLNDPQGHYIYCLDCSYSND